MEHHEQVNINVSPYIVSCFVLDYDSRGEFMLKTGAHLNPRSNSCEDSYFALPDLIPCRVWKPSSQNKPHAREEQDFHIVILNQTDTSMME